MWWLFLLDIDKNWKYLEQIFKITFNYRENNKIDLGLPFVNKLIKCILNNEHKFQLEAIRNYSSIFTNDDAITKYVACFYAVPEDRKKANDYQKEIISTTGFKRLAELSKIHRL